MLVEVWWGVLHVEYPRIQHSFTPEVIRLPKVGKLDQQ